jgi:hypothetical protein
MMNFNKYLTDSMVAQRLYYQNPTLHINLSQFCPPPDLIT